MSIELTSPPAVVAVDEAVTGEEKRVEVPAEAAVEVAKSGDPQVVPEETAVDVVEPGTPQNTLENGHKRIEGNSTHQQQTGEEHMATVLIGTAQVDLDNTSDAEVKRLTIKAAEENKMIQMQQQAAQATGQSADQQALALITVAAGRVEAIEKKINSIEADYARVDTTRVFVKSGFAIAGAVGGYMAVDAMAPGAPTALLIGGAVVGAGVGAQIGEIACDIYQVAGQKKSASK